MTFDEIGKKCHFVLKKKKQNKNLCFTITFCKKGNKFSIPFLILHFKLLIFSSEFHFNKVKLINITT